VTFDLDLDFEHTLDAGSLVDHPVQKFGRNRAICVVVEAVCAESLLTDGETDDGRRAIVLAREMS